MESKDTIRQRALRLRAGLSAAERAELDAKITLRCQTEIDWSSIERVMAFLPIEHQHEINTWPLIRWIWSHLPSVSVYIPVVRGKEMDAMKITPLTTYVSGAFGTSEPDDEIPLAPDSHLDVVLAPLLGFDLQGNRIGYGRGYFDRFLSDHRQARRVGLAYEILLVEAGIPATPQDMRLQSVITDTRSLNF